jgi:hypothetical protein
VTDPAIIPAIISGAVASVAIVGSVVTTGLTLRHQRKAEDQRRRHERHLRLLDSGLKAGVDFLAAADRTTRARQDQDSAGRVVGNAKSSADEKMYEHLRTNWEEARAGGSAAIADAESAYAAVRMLVPSAADQARRYLDYCIQADIHPDTTKVERQRARQMVEKTLQDAFGGDLPADWIFADSAPGSRRPRRWKIPLPRRAKRHEIAGPARQP